MHLLLAAIDKPFIPGWDTPGGLGLRPFVGELWIIATIVAVLLTPFFTRRSYVACAFVAMVGLAIALVSVLTIGNDPHLAGNYFRGLLVVDSFVILWKLMLLLFVLGIILMWFSTTAQSMHE